MAIAGGVNLSSAPEQVPDAEPGGASLSSDGRCESFGRAATATCPARASARCCSSRSPRRSPTATTSTASSRRRAINHGGKTNGYTVPNPQAQARGDRAGARQARASTPRAVSYIEAHGTGTALGDPIEIAGLSKAFAAVHAGQAVLRDRLGQVEHRALRERGGHRRRDQGAAADEARAAGARRCTRRSSIRTSTSASTPFVVQQELAPWKRPVVDGRDVPAHRRHELLRRRRLERARDRGGVRGAGAGGRGGNAAPR